MQQYPILRTLQEWQESSQDRREETLNGLAEQLGADWRKNSSSVGRAGLGSLLNARLNLEFLVVPGGWLRMGVSCDDMFAYARARRSNVSKCRFNGARPCRWVRIVPFLLARTGILHAAEVAGKSGSDATQAAAKAYQKQVGEIKKQRRSSEEEEKEGKEESQEDSQEEEPRMMILEGCDKEEILGQVPEGFRLVSEAELEWVLREGGTTRWIGVPGDVEVRGKNRDRVLLGSLGNGFGLQGIVNLQNVCADGCVPYDAEPTATDQRAKHTDEPELIMRSAHTCWQDSDDEMAAVLAGSRSGGDDCGDSIVRLACDLPCEMAAAEPPPKSLAEHGQTLQALFGEDATLREHAQCALDGLARGPGADVRDTAAAVLIHLQEGSEDDETTARLLRWIAAAETGWTPTSHPASVPFDEIRAQSRRLGRDSVCEEVGRHAPYLKSCLQSTHSSQVREAASLALEYCTIPILD